MADRNDHVGREVPRLGPLETQVMDSLWDVGPATVRRIIDRLPGNSAYTTIATVLGNLSKKGLVTAKRETHSTEYSACCTREEYVAAVMNQALGSSPNRSASILHFIGTMPESDLDLLRTYLRQHDGDRAPDGERRLPDSP